MIARVYSRWAGLGRAGLTALIFLSVLGLAQATGVKTKAVLIWGSNDETSPDPKHKPVDPVLGKTLAGIFKWKYYFEVRKTEATIAEGATNSFVMSEKCIVEVKNLGSNSISVALFGDGKLGSKGKHPFPPGYQVTLAGPVENNTAWFVVLQNTAAPAASPVAAVSSNKAPPAVSTNSTPKSN